jgi:hypothetical protein
VARQNKKRTYLDKKGRQYQKHSYFVGGKMKFHRIYVVDGIPVDEFYENNATVIDLVIDENFHLIKDSIDFDDSCTRPNPVDKNDIRDFPF